MIGGGRDLPVLFYLLINLNLFNFIVCVLV